MAAADDPMQAVVDIFVDTNGQLPAHRPFSCCTSTTTVSSRGADDATLPSMEPHPWLKPVERRVGVALACLVWLGFEAWYDPGGLWFWLALGAAVYAIWDFFLSGSYRDATE